MKILHMFAYVGFFQYLCGKIDAKQVFMKRFLLALACAAMMMPMQAKTLVAYFSATGTTKVAAVKLAKQHNAQLWEIEPAEKYTAADLDWRNPQSRSSLEMNDPEERPMIKQCTDVTRRTTPCMSVFLFGGVSVRVSSIRGWITMNRNCKAKS